MADKLNLPDIGSLGNPVSARAAINTNFQAIENAFDNTLSRDGTTPNQMEADIDLNGNDLLNVKRIDVDELYRNGVPFEQLVAYSNKRYQIFSGTGGQTIYTLEIDPGSLGNLEISVGGVMQRPGVDYSYTGTTLTFVTAPLAGTNNILVRYDEALPTGVTTASAITVTASGAGAVPRTVEDKLREFVSVKDYGAKGDGVTDDTAAIQVALDAIRVAGGGDVYMPPGVYIFSQSLRIGSNTRLYGAGDATTLKANQTSYVGINTGTDATTNCQAIRNYNHAASSLTDSDIAVESMTIDWGAVTIAGGGAHCVSMRYVDRCRVVNVFGVNGENVTAFRSCRDSLVDSCHGLNQKNCFYDHWESAGNCTVRNCTGRAPGVNINQGIQMNDAGDGSNSTSLDFLVEGCNLYRVRGASGQSAAIAVGALDAAGFVRRARTIGNYVEDADIGLVFSGGGGQHLSMGDTFKGVDQLPIFLQQNTASPSHCRIINPHLIDCDHSVANVAMVVFNGDRNEVRGLKVSNTGAALYDVIARFTTNATNCFLEIDDAPTGASSRIATGGTNNRIKDQFNNYESGTWTPEVKFGGASVGVSYTVQSAKYTRIGDRIFWDVRVNLSSKGSSTGAATIEGLPFTAESAGSIFYGINMASSANMSGTNTNLEGFVNGASIVLRNGGTATQLTDANFTNTSTLLLGGSFNV